MDSNIKDVCLSGFNAFKSSGVHVELRERGDKNASGHYGPI
jgi:hypothetical protein